MGKGSAAPLGFSVCAPHPAARKKKETSTKGFPLVMGALIEAEPGWSRGPTWLCVLVYQEPG